MEVTEASVEVMEAFTEASSTAGIMEASVEAFMQDIEYMKASVNVYSTGASTKVSTKAFIQVISTKASMEAFMSVMEAFVEVMESFMEMAYFNGILYGSFRGSFHENMQYSQASVQINSTGAST